MKGQTVNMSALSYNAESGQLLCTRVYAKVFGCLTPRMLAVVIGPGSGFAQIVEIPLWVMPFGLRMPNTFLDLLFDEIGRNYVAALPPDAENTDARFHIITSEEWCIWREQNEN